MLARVRDVSSNVFARTPTRTVGVAGDVDGACGHVWRRLVALEVCGA